MFLLLHTIPFIYLICKVLFLHCAYTLLYFYIDNHFRIKHVVLLILLATNRECIAQCQFRGTKIVGYRIKALFFRDRQKPAYMTGSTNMR